MRQRTFGCSEPENLVRKKVSIQKLSSNEVYCTNALLLRIKIMLCSKLDYQKGFNLIHFSYKIPSKPAVWEVDLIPASIHNEYDFGDRRSDFGVS